MCDWVNKYCVVGLVVIGVYILEYFWECLLFLLCQVVKDWWIIYLVVVDNEYVIWNVFGN